MFFCWLTAMMALMPDTMKRFLRSFEVILPIFSISPSKSLRQFLPAYSLLRMATILPSSAS